MGFNEFEFQMRNIIKAIREEGYEPYKQLAAYVLTGDASYITRSAGARDQILMLDKDDVRDFLKMRGVL